MKKLLVTVGAQMPFDRLIRAVDAWAAEHPEHRVLAQVGETDHRPAHTRWTKFLMPDDFDREFDGADAIIGHAGIGTLFAAMQRGKPILVLPRESARRETRNDHQIATARAFEAYSGVIVAWTEDEVAAGLDRLLATDGSTTLGDVASGPLVERIARFVDEA
ncbi:MAG: hypothetical protein H6719_04455 [Sandaracinaceae bacterium]|nr:hypothetical protein [Sandaracinaceae bacterium]